MNQYYNSLNQGNRHIVNSGDSCIESLDKKLSTLVVRCKTSKDLEKQDHHWMKVLHQKLMMIVFPQ